MIKILTILTTIIMIGGEWSDLKEEDIPISCGFEGEQRTNDAVIIKY